MTKPIKAGLKRAYGKVVITRTGKALEITFEPQHDLPPGHHPPTITYLLFAQQVADLRDVFESAITEMATAATPPSSGQQKH
jgi:hypothetical protein